MITKVQKWGNSQGIRIPKNLLKNTHIQVGEEVELAIIDGRIIIEPTKKIHGRYKIEELAKQMPNGYNPTEEDWGDPAGKEVW